MSITRIVKLCFEPEHLDAFKQIFVEKKEKIEAFQGCHSVIMLQDIHDPTICFTYSHWDSEEALNAYRNSDFFGETWARTKKLFRDKPEAWSVQNV